MTASTGGTCRRRIGIGLLFTTMAVSACDGDERCLQRVGVICTIAGSGDQGYGEDADDRALPALDTELSHPMDTLTAADGTVFILDWNNHRVRSLGVDGRLRHVAGTTPPGGGLGEPLAMDLRHPTNMVFDGPGTLIVADWRNSQVRSVDIASGSVSVVAGRGGRGYYGDGGLAVESTLHLPSGVALSPDGDIVFLDQGNQVIRAVDGDGVIHTIAGQCVNDRFEPCDPVACPDDAGGRPSGVTTCGDPDETCEGTFTCMLGYAGDGEKADQMRMAQATGGPVGPGGRLLFDKSGNLYFADTFNHLIRMIDSEGVVHRIAGFVPDEGVMGGYSGDGGPATEAQLRAPVDLAFADDGTLYVSDVYNHCIRAIDTAGVITTVAGQCGVKGDGGDGGDARDALLHQPHGIEWADGRLLISDTGNHVIRAVPL